MQDSDQLVNDSGPNVKLVLQEYQQASPLGESLFDANWCENVRRNLWPGQSPDGRRWDEWAMDGEPALPWNGASDTRVPGVDSTINDMVDLGMTAFRRAEVRGRAINPDRVDLVGPLGAYAHWLVRERYQRPLEKEAELALQYCGEYGYCVAYVGWERELAKRRVTVTLEQLAALEGNAEGGMQNAESQGLVATIMEPELEEAAATMIQEIYKLYAQQSLASKGFYEDELEDEKLLKLSPASAKKFVRELRTQGKVDVPMPYVCKNKPSVYMCRPYHEFLCARGTTEIQSAALLFLRRTFTKAELEAKKAEGWDADWVEAAKKTAGQLSMWGNPMGDPTTSPTNLSPSKMVGGTRWYKLTQHQYDRIEVVYAFRRCVDEDGVTEIFQTIFSPHVTHGDAGQEICAKHEPLEDAHGEYPFIEYKRENLGRGLTESRSVAELGGTWQMEEKKQRDSLFNRSDLEILPPIGVPRLSGVDYRIGPGAQVPIKRGDKFEKLIELGPPPTLGLELIKLLGVQRADYFGEFHPELPPAKTAAKQAKRAGDFFAFMGAVILKLVALSAQYNPQEIVRVTGSKLLLGLDPYDVMEELEVGLAFDVMELDQEYLLKKLEIISTHIEAGDVGGVMDRNALTEMRLRMLDSRLADRIIMQKGAASQQVFNDVMAQTVRMMAGNEAQYVENDPSAAMKMQYLNEIVSRNPVYQQMLQSNERFQALMENYAKSLQQSMVQQENKMVGRVGVKQLT